MTKFERWQIVVGCIQTTLLMFTLISAIYIGFRQTQINENLLNLNFIPSVEIAYSNGRLQIYNKGMQNIWFWGTKFDDESPTIEKDPRLITPGGFYYIFGDRLERRIKSKIGEDGEIRFPFELFLESSNKIRYIIRNQLFCIAKKGQIYINSQTLALIQRDWSSEP